MPKIIDRQTFVITANTFNMNTAVPAANPTASIINLPLVLRFAADSLIVKQISYSPSAATPDAGDMLLIYCNLTNDKLIASIPNGSSNVIPLAAHHDDYFSLSNTFQSGTLVLQIQSGTIPALIYYSSDPQPLISLQNPQKTYGILSLTIEFQKHAREGTGYQQFEYS